MSILSVTTHNEFSDLHDEQRELAMLTVDLDCSQQKFFQGEYGRHRRSPTVALLLCLLLGNFGAHEFYFGRVLSGLVRLLFCWTLVPWLIALVEAPRVPAYARQYNAELAQSIVDMLYEIRGQVRRLDGVASGAAQSSAAAPVARAFVAPVAVASAAPAASSSASTSQSSGSLGRAAIGAVALAPIVMLSAEAAALASAHHSAPDYASAAEDDTADRTTATPTSAEAESERAREPVFSYTMAPTRHPPVRYGPPLAETPATPQRQRIRRIVVRKVATVNGEAVGEAVATREVSLDEDAATLPQRIERATDEARQEALQLLATRVPPEVLAEADSDTGSYNFHN